jgi:tetratricopeptide (TPR) repeat protein
MNSSQASADREVAAAFRLQQAGDWAAAEAGYRCALQSDGRHAAALQLLGLVLRRRGELIEAETCMRRSLEVLPDQAHVWNNLGNLLGSQARDDEARACYVEALRQRPGYADAHYNLARLLHRQGALAAAAASLRSAFAAQPRPSAAMWQLQAQLQADAGELAMAQATLEGAIQSFPDRPALSHNLAILLQRRHRPADALVVHERALALGLDAADAHYNHGNTLQSLGRLEEAAAAYRMALKRQPGHALSLHDLARLRWRMGDTDFDAEMRQAIQEAPTSGWAAAQLAQLMLHADRLVDAESLYRVALSREPRVAAWHDGLAQCLMRQGRLDEGLSEHAAAVNLLPQDATLLASHARGLLQSGRPDAAAELAGQAVALAPNDQHAWAVLGLAWRALGDVRERWLNDYDTFVSVVDLPVPPGFIDMRSFNQALAGELDGLHHDNTHPIEQTLRTGTQTLGDIFEQQHGLVDVLKQGIAAAVDAYVAALPDDPTHPFLRRRGAWRFADSWSSRLRDGGYHTNHVHTHGWISGTYYVCVPEAVHDASRQQGWLRFGESDLALQPGSAVRRAEQPLAGRLVLFPSLFWHGTSAFSSAQSRLSIAFDVVPRAIRG